MNGNLLVLNN